MNRRLSAGSRFLLERMYAPLAGARASTAAACITTWAGPFADEAAYNELLISDLAGHSIVPDMIRTQMRTDHDIVLTHGDLHAINIMVQPEVGVVAIIDWELAGYYPEYIPRATQAVPSGRLDVWLLHGAAQHLSAALRRRVRGRSDALSVQQALMFAVVRLLVEQTATRVIVMPPRRDKHWQARPVSLISAAVGRRARNGNSISVLFCSASRCLKPRPPSSNGVVSNSSASPLNLFSYQDHSSLR